MLPVTACGLVYITDFHDIDFRNITLYLISPKTGGGLSFLAHKILLYMIVLTISSIPRTVLGTFLYQQAEEAVDILYTHTTSIHIPLSWANESTPTHTHTHARHVWICTLGCRVHKLLHTHLHTSQSVMHSCKLVPCPPWLFQLLVSIWQPRPLAEWLRRQTSLWCLSVHRHITCFPWEESSFKWNRFKTCLVFVPVLPSDQFAPAWVDV